MDYVGSPGHELGWTPNGKRFMMMNNRELRSRECESVCIAASLSLAIVSTNQLQAAPRSTSSTCKLCVATDSGQPTALTHQPPHRLANAHSNSWPPSPREQVWLRLVASHHNSSSRQRAPLCVIFVGFRVAETPLIPPHMCPASYSKTRQCGSVRHVRPRPPQVVQDGRDQRPPLEGGVPKPLPHGLQPRQQKGLLCGAAPRARWVQGSALRVWVSRG